MSRILRRPMFRGGSTSNEGIMSVPRKGYKKAGGVQDFDVSDYYPSSSSVDGGLFGSSEENEYTPAGITISDSGIDLNKIDSMANKTIQSKNIPDERLKNLSASDILMAEYLGNRPDPLGKFLINFGLNYMSARPRGGKFGALATAADAAKKPTEQLYSDIDTDRLLKLKLMSALGKSETAGSFEKKVNFIWKSELNKPEGQRAFKSKEDVVDYIRKQESERKETSPEEQRRQRTKEIMSSVGGAPNQTVANNMAEFEIEGIKKIAPKERAKLDLKGSYFLPALSVRQKPNSTDFAFLKPDKSILGNLEEGLNYVDPGSKSVYTYVGPNTFRLVGKY